MLLRTLLTEDQVISTVVMSIALIGIADVGIGIAKVMAAMVIQR